MYFVEKAATMAKKAYLGAMHKIVMRDTQKVAHNEHSKILGSFILLGLISFFQIKDKILATKLWGKSTQSYTNTIVNVMQNKSVKIVISCVIFL